MNVRIRRPTLVLAILTAELGIGASFLVDAIRHTGWHIGFDVWLTWRAAQYVADGALGYVYESVDFPSPALPLLPILLAPVALVGNALDLRDAYPRPYPNPSAWLLLGPVCSLSAIPFVYALTGAARRFVEGRRSLAVVAVGIALGVPPIFYWGHYEDLLALSCVLAALCWTRDGRLLRAAAVLGVGIAFKQWAAVLLPILLAGPWRKDALRTIGASVALPAALAAFVLAVDWAHASRALASPTYYYPGTRRHVVPWLADRRGEIPTTVPRLVFLAAVLLFAVWVGRRLRDESPETLLAAAAAVLVVRSLTEVLPYSYYAAPGIVLAVLAEGASGRPPFRTAFLGAALLLLFRWSPDLWTWWLAYVAVGAVLLAVTLRCAKPAAQAVASEP